MKALQKWFGRRGALPLTSYLAALATGRKVEPLDPEMVKAELGEPDSWANYLQK